MPGVLMRTPDFARGPFADLDAVRREVNGLLRSFDRRPADGGGNVPAFNVYEADDAVVLTAELPGLGPDAVEVSVRADEVTVAGEWPAGETPSPEEPASGGASDGAGGGHWLRRERPKGRFTRTLRLPFTPPVDGATAEFDRGVLTLTLNKPAETQPRRVAVTVK